MGNRIEGHLVKHLPVDDMSYFLYTVLAMSLRARYLHVRFPFAVVHTKAANINQPAFWRDHRQVRPLNDSLTQHMYNLYSDMQHAAF